MKYEHPFTLTIGNKNPNDHKMCLNLNTGELFDVVHLVESHPGSLTVNLSSAPDWLEDVIAGSHPRLEIYSNRGPLGLQHFLLEWETESHDFAKDLIRYTRPLVHDSAILHRNGKIKVAYDFGSRIFKPGMNLADQPFDIFARVLTDAPVFIGA